MNDLAHHDATSRRLMPTQQKARAGAVEIKYLDVVLSDPYLDLQ